MQDPQTHQIIGAAMEVHRTLGPGFLEAVYQDALQIELAAAGVPALREHPVPVHYKGQLLSTPYRADFLCFDRVVVELKAASGIRDEHVAQVLHYLAATRLRCGLLLNFGTGSLQVKRLAGRPSHPDPVAVGRPHPPGKEATLL